MADVFLSLEMTIPNVVKLETFMAPKAINLLNYCLARDDVVKDEQGLYPKGGSTSRDRLFPAPHKL